MQRAENLADTQEPRSGKRSRSAPRAKNYAHRRRAQRAAVAAAPAVARQATLLEFWNAHAIKTGMALFWTWFGIANWSSLQQVIGF